MEYYEYGIEKCRPEVQEHSGFVFLYFEKLAGAGVLRAQVPEHVRH